MFETDYCSMPASWMRPPALALQFCGPQRQINYRLWLCLITLLAFSSALVRIGCLCHPLSGCESRSYPRISLDSPALSARCHPSWWVESILYLWGLLGVSLFVFRTRRSWVLECRSERTLHQAICGSPADALLYPLIQSCRSILGHIHQSTELLAYLLASDGRISFQHLLQLWSSWDHRCRI